MLQSTPSSNIEAAYAATEGLLDDEAQRAIVAKLADLERRLRGAADRRPAWLQRICRRSSRTPIRGLYLWGGVGRGKTFLMDLFFSTLPIRSKKRIHFHRMMGEIQTRLKSLVDVADPLDRVAAALAEEACVLCFDEFFVSDIGDAMILGRLLDGLFDRGVTLIATSNVAPSDLYRDGLQRERFLPAIRSLELHTDVIELSSGPDYRLRLLEQAGTYLSATEHHARQRLTDYFCRIAPGATERDRVLDVLGRPIRTVRCAKGVVWFEFEELCGGPRSQHDYVEIARCYQTVILSDVPVLTPQHENAARRFIALVDEFYDRRVKLILSAHAGVDRLYQGSRLRFEFERARSRLIEMQSEAYLHAPHLS